MSPEAALGIVAVKATKKTDHIDTDIGTISIVQNGNGRALPMILQATMTLIYPTPLRKPTLTLK